MSAAAASFTPPALGALLADHAGLGALAGVHASDLVLDSREVGPGTAFVAIPGSRSDGRDHIAAALGAGAVAVLAEAGRELPLDPRVVAIDGLRAQCGTLARRFFGDPSAAQSLVAVTGTNGKTSVADYVAQLLRALGHPAGCIGTLGARLSAAVAEATNTTPDVFTLNRQLRRWLDQGVRFVALEASSHALDQDRLDGLDLRVGVFTNLTRDHLDYHGSEAAYAAAKLRLFRDFALDTAIFNADDPVASRVATLCTDRAIGITTGTAAAPVRVTARETAGQLMLALSTPWGDGSVSLGLAGRFNAFNAAAAMVAVTRLGFDFERVCEVAAGLTPVPGRMERVDNRRGVNVVVDYAHTPDALDTALASLRDATPGRLWVVFGCGGDRDTGKRGLMGEVARQRADRLVVTSDNPRSEPPEAIIAAVLAGAGPDAQVVPDRAAAIREALTAAAPGDTVLIAGKGHENYQEIAGVRQPFSDVEVARRCLTEVADA